MEHFWQGYNLKAFGIPREAFPPPTAKGKHGYTITCGTTNSVSCFRCSVFLLEVWGFGKSKLVNFVW